jgi:hypothetical protein
VIRRSRDGVCDLVQFAQYFTGFELQGFHGRAYRRFTFYFVNGDERLERELILPDLSVPGAVGDLRIERCGKSIKEFRKAHDWLAANDAPEYVRECVYRSEKAVDTQICADALQLAAVDKLDRLFLYTNDYDFVPLCRALRHLGLNVNVFRIHAASVNRALVEECDAFHVMKEWGIKACFLPIPPAPSSDTSAPKTSERTDTEASGDSSTAATPNDAGQ